MLHTGVTSVTFRQMRPDEIVSLTVKAGLEAIEWGGDVHVPHGDIKAAAETLKMTRDAGLIVSSYGSYYRVGCGKNTNPPFEAVLHTAIELGTSCIRVWAGDRGTDKANEKWWDTVVKDSINIAAVAQKENINIAYEFHGNTLTDTNESAVRLIKAVGMQNVGIYWQPPVDTTFEYRREGLKAISLWLKNLHVFNWQGICRLPLSEGKNEWAKYLKLAARANGDRFAIIEFVKGDSPEQFLKDAMVLRELIETIKF